MSDGTDGIFEVGAPLGEARTDMTEGPLADERAANAATQGAPEGREMFTRGQVDEIAGLCRHMGYGSAEAIIQLREEGRLPFTSEELSIVTGRPEDGPTAMRAKRRSRSVELMEVREAGGILGVAQKAIEQADALVQRGSKTTGRALTRQRVREAQKAADEAQRAINAELEAGRR